VRWSVAALLAVSANFSPYAQTPTQDPRPVFRGGANLVLVDVYPRRDGKVIEGLKPSDFEVLEDGKPQAIDQFEFVRIEPVPEAERRDPNNQREMLQQAADPHNRVFVVYLDTYHVTLTGSHDIRRPLVEMLNRIVAPNDLFGVTTSKVNPKSLVLGRRMLSVEEQLSRNWPWAERNRTSNDPDDPAEDFLARCGLQNLRDRRREESTLENFRQLMEYVGTFREARTQVIVITDGWLLYTPDQTLIPRGDAPRPAGIGVDSSGRLGSPVGMTPYAYAGGQACASEAARLALLDDQRLFRDIIDLANRRNVVFYPVNPAGLEAFDGNLVPAAGTAGGGAYGGRPSDMTSSNPVAASMDRHTARVDSVLTLAENTDGIAVVNTNDLRAGLNRIVNDVSAYYLLGYYSTSPLADGRYRQIKVRVKQEKVAVSARRGYVASKVEPAAPAANTASPDVTESLGALARIGASALFAYGIVSGKDLAVVAEIAGSQIEVGKWRDGGSMKVVVSSSTGAQVGTVTGTIEPGARAALARVPIGTSVGPWNVSVTVTGRDGTFEDRIDIKQKSAALLADPIVYRATGVARAAVLRPAAEFLYRRTERVHVEWPVLKPLDQRTARVLDRRGQPLPVAATLTERDDAGQAMLVADVSLAQLSPGDYVLEVSAGSGAETQKRFVAVRVVR